MNAPCVPGGMAGTTVTAPLATIIRAISAGPELLASLRAMVAFHDGEDDADKPELATARALLARLDGAA